MSKRGLIKPIIVVGILILILVSAFVFIQQTFEEKGIVKSTSSASSALSASTTLEYPSEIIMVQKQIERCLERSASAGIFLMGVQGGYIYKASGPTLETGHAVISFGMIDGKNKLPSKSHMEDELASYVDGNFASCIDNFSIFRRRGYGFSHEKAISRADIEDDVITVFLDFPVTINHEGIIYGLENFVVVMPIRLGMIIDTANDIIDESEDIGVEGLGFDFFSGFDPYVTLLPVEDATIVALHDESSGVDGEEFEFLFAIQ